MIVDPATLQIGSGLIPAIAGCSRWKTQMDAWNQLMGYEPPRDNDELTLGDILEEPIARAACLKLGIGGYAKATTLYHPAELWARATPDWWIDLDGKANLETKNVGVSPGPHGPLNDWEQDHEPHLPEYVFVQVQWQLGLWAAQEDPAFTGRGRVAALLGGRGPEMFRVEYDPTLFSDLMTVADRFRRKHLLLHVPPSAPDGSDAFARYLKSRYPKASGTWEVATPEEEQLIVDFRAAEGEAKRWETSKKAAGQALQLAIGDRTGIIGAAGRVQCYERRGYDVAPHRVEPTRVLKAKWAKEEAKADAA